jgi:hypothetical protein
MTLAPGIELPVGKVAEICRKYQVRELAVFGSAARGEMRPDSDTCWWNSSRTRGSGCSNSPRWRGNSPL